MATVKVFKGHKVPEGAKRAYLDGEECRFLKKGISGEVLSLVGLAWVPLPRRYNKWPKDSIELPQEQEQEYIPKVGEECLVEYPYDDGCFKPFHGTKVTILGKCSGYYGESVYAAHGSKGYIALTASGFRPLKTEREKTVDAAIAVMNNSLDDSQQGWALALYDHGMLKMSGGES